MKVLAGAMGLVVVLTLTVAAGAFAQMTGDGSTNNVSTHNNGTDPQSTDRTALGSTGQLPDIPCDGYHYAADFTIVPDTPASPTPTAPQSQEQPTQTVTTQ